MAKSKKIVSNDLFEMAFLIDVPAAIADLKRAMSFAFSDAINFIIKNFQAIIIDPMILGGKGWRSLVSTQSWKWINSPKGYAQLGFSNPLEPLKLLNALRTSWTVTKIFNVDPSSNKMNVGIRFAWGDIEQLRQATIHPAAGKLRLPADQSWFDWIYAGQPEKEEGWKFKRTGPRKGVRSSLIAGEEAGRMVPGSFWSVPPTFRLDLERLFKWNEKKIAGEIRDYMAMELKRALE